MATAQDISQGKVLNRVQKRYGDPLPTNTWRLFLGEVADNIIGGQRIAADRGLLPVMADAGRDIGRSVVAPVKRYFIGQPQTQRPGTAPVSSPSADISPAPTAITAAPQYSGRVRSLADATARARFLGANDWASPEARATAMGAAAETNNSAIARAAGARTLEDQQAFTNRRHNQAADVIRDNADRAAGVETAKYAAIVDSLKGMKENGAPDHAVAIEAIKAATNPVSGFKMDDFLNIMSLVGGQAAPAQAAGVADIDGDGIPTADEYQVKKAQQAVELHKKGDPSVTDAVLLHAQAILKAHAAKVSARAENLG